MRQGGEGRRRRRRGRAGPPLGATHGGTSVVCLDLVERDAHLPMRNTTPPSLVALSAKLKRKLIRVARGSLP